MTEQKNTFRFIPFLPGIAWFLFVLALICMPGDDLPEEPAGLFGGLVFWFCLPFRKMMITRPQKINWFIKITIASILWGIATEYIQKFFLTGRQFDLVDWAADSAGAIIAFFLSRKLFLNPKPNTSNLKL